MICPSGKPVCMPDSSGKLQLIMKQENDYGDEKGLRRSPGD